KSQFHRAAEWLLENQNEDGGWPFSGLPGGNLPSDADDTALATLALLKSGVSKDHAAIQRSLEWLRSHQSENGGWGTYIPGTGDVSCVSITSHVIEVCLAIDELQEAVAKAINWLKATISDSGYWSDLWLARNTYGTALAIVALIKSGQPDCAEVKRGIKWLEENQNPDGGWGEDMMGNKRQSTTEQTAWSTYALLLLDSDSSSAQKGLEYLLSHQNPDGSWPASCVGIYWEVIGGYIDPVYASVFSLMALNQAESL
ncbi:prenyltransferase/squalene oxidase repeat-containing protein, partial [Candidatus Poribacteria bacterium]